MKNEIEKLAEFINAEDGLEAYVINGSGGFHAIMRDTDAGEVIDVRIFPVDLEGAFDKAVAYARKNVNADADFIAAVQGK